MAGAWLRPDPRTCRLRLLRPAVALGCHPGNRLLPARQPPRPQPAGGRRDAQHKHVDFVAGLRQCRGGAGERRANHHGHQYRHCSGNQHVVSGRTGEVQRGGTCSSATLAKGASCTITFTYAPTSAVANNATYTITGGGGKVNISLSGKGTATASPNLSASPPLVEFGNVTVGQKSAATTVTVSNTVAPRQRASPWPAAMPRASR